ncbi:MAG TPA: DUF1844 domain-containing protein [Candidatus Polarisedimenticolia bacterium]|nr:DUF1844 domain-containing protein [Candidatus Polarisedimenticolia bacterium]
MTDKKIEPGRQQEIRVIDRRSFTSDGDRRSPDADITEESPASSAAPPAANQVGQTAAPRFGGDEAIPSVPFQSLVLNLARQAATHLGAAPNPLSGQVEIDLDAAQQMIDLLDALRLKTRGNVTQDEGEMIEELIGDLQMQFVTVRSKDPKTS